MFLAEDNHTNQKVALGLSSLGTGRLMGLSPDHHWIERFLHHLQTERRLAENTRKHYQRDLHELHAWCEQGGISDWREVQTRHVRHYAAQCHRRGLSGRSIQRRLSALRSFYNYLLREGALAWAGLGHLDLSFLGLISYIGVIAAMVQILEMTLDRFVPRLYNALGIFLPLITVNCAILGGSLFSIQRNYDLVESVVFGLGSGAGWALAVILLAGILVGVETGRYEYHFGLEVFQCRQPVIGHGSAEFGAFGIHIRP